MPNSSGSSRRHERWRRKPVGSFAFRKAVATPDTRNSSDSRHGEDSSMIDFLAGDSSNTDKELAIESLKAEVSRILKLLTDKEQKVLRAFFGIDGSPEMTLDEIGEKYNLTRERVRQIKEKALRRLRHNTKNKLLKSYLGQ